VGKGTVFTIELPLSTSSADVVVVESPSEHTAKGQHVLIAEDEPALRRTSQRVLERAGYTVHTAADGREALRRIDELGDRLSLLFTDVVMPGAGGYEVAEHAERVAPHAAIILTSGYLDEASQRGRKEELPMLWKPVTPNELTRFVASTLAANKRARTEPAPVQDDGVVLVVEDDEVVRRAMLRTLTRAGREVIGVGTIAAARAHLESSSEPLAVFCDLSLADGPGPELGVVVSW
jgi:DNA-binding NtrC family response regulator